MDRAMVERHLAQAERHVVEGSRHVVRQRQIVAELADDGDDLKLAQELLARFEELLVSHIADRDRIRAELTTF
jgi:hemerythrin